MFDKSKFESKVKSIIGVEDVDFDYEEYYEQEDNGSIIARVDIKVLPKAWENWNKSHQMAHDMLMVHIKSRVPKLVSAKLNDIVLVYAEYADSEDDLDVGVVTAVHETSEGTCYGCRHFSLKPASIFGFGEVELTQEDYGGHPVGFYRVLTREEGLALLTKQIKREMAKKIEDAKERMDELDVEVAKILEEIRNSPTATSSSIVCKNAIRPNNYR